MVHAGVQEYGCWALKGLAADVNLNRHRIAAPPAFGLLCIKDAIELHPARPDVLLQALCERALSLSC